MTTTRLSRGFWQKIQHADPDANFAAATPMHQPVEVSRRLLVGYFQWPISHEPGSINSVHSPPVLRDHFSQTETQDSPCTLLFRQRDEECLGCYSGPPAHSVSDSPVAPFLELHPEPRLNTACVYPYRSTILVAAGPFHKPCPRRASYGLV